jgi:predicted RNase H-like HicB family nuclease
MKRFLVVFEKTETGYTAYVPDLPGCIATGEDKNQTESAIYEGIQFHLEGMLEESMDIPEGNAESEILVFS